MHGTRSGCRTSTRSKKNQIQNRAITLTTAQKGSTALLILS
jgi:hypothetical protein